MVRLVLVVDREPLTELGTIQVWVPSGSLERANDVRLHVTGAPISLTLLLTCTLYSVRVFERLPARVSVAPFRSLREMRPNMATQRVTASLIRPGPTGSRQRRQPRRRDCFISADVVRLDARLPHSRFPPGKLPDFRLFHINGDKRDKQIDKDTSQTMSSARQSRFRM